MSDFEQIDSHILTTEYGQIELQASQLILDFVRNCDAFINEITSHQSFCKENQYVRPYRFSFSERGVDLVCGFYPQLGHIYIGSKKLYLEMLALGFGSLLKEKTGQLEAHTYKIASLNVNDSPSVIEKLSYDYNLPLFSHDDFEDVFEKSDLLVRSLKKDVSSYKLSLFEKISDHALGLSANFELIRVHLLKFLAILPCLDHDKSGTEVKRVFLEMLRRLISDSHSAHVKKYTGQKRSLPKFYIILFSLALNLCTYIHAGFLSSVIKFVVAKLAKRFIAGENIQNARGSLRSLIDSNRDATLDQLGELIVSPGEAQEYKEKVIEIIEGINEHIKKGARNKAQINRAHVSIKVSALAHDFRPEAFEHVYEQVAPKLLEILIKAKENEVFINIDAEHYSYRDMVFKIYSRVLIDNQELHDFADTGIVLQAYLRDAYKHFQDILSLAKQRKLVMPIRLVKGAYWDAETIEARAHNFDAYQFLNKEETDLHFRQLVDAILKEDQSLCLALASHNILDHCFGEALREVKYPKSRVIEHQCLHMTYEGLSVGLEKMGWVTRNYIPIGNLLIGMAYLVRRIMENSSQVGILTIMRSHKKELANITPFETLKTNRTNLLYEYDESISKTGMDFFNINPMRVYKKCELGSISQFLIEPFSCISITNDTAEEVEEKIARLVKSNSLYRDYNLYTSVIKLSQLMLINRSYLSALIMQESGKTIREAIADVDEAIDFINFYLREELKDLKIKDNVPLGVVGVIAPWNFPLAIACGMSIAALVTGNKVILKPSECTPRIIDEWMKLVREAGISNDLFEVSHGDGQVGDLISSHKDISGIVFTGSKKVGVNLFKKLHSSQYDSDVRFNDKVCISEMGGKNAIIITNNCELDETISGVIYSAFAHAGQKCSAASRIIIDKKIKDKFVLRLIQALEAIKIGDPLDLSTYINPLIRKSDKERILSLMPKICEEAKAKDGKVHLDKSFVESHLNLVGPVVIEVTKKQAMKNTSFAKQELFAPIIHIIEYSDLSEAIKIFNSTQYALTGGVYCQSQDDIDYLCSKMKAGNIYVNRPNTGARVGIEPFGGFRMSGTGPKAGGIDYLSSFKANPLEHRQIEKDDSSFKSMPFLERYQSGLSYKSRKEKGLKVVETILSQYESFSHSIDHESREILEKLSRDIMLDRYDIKNSSLENIKIPGQISLSKKDLSIGNGIFITNHTRFDTRIFSMVIVNLVLGNAFTFVCTSNKAKQSWDKVFEHIYACGFSSFNAGIILSHINELEYAISSSHFIAYNNEISLSGELKSMIQQIEFTSFLPRMINVDRFALRLWETEQLNLFTNTRSFAINTMRHGAPLELEL